MVAVRAWAGTAGPLAAFRDYRPLQRTTSTFAGTIAHPRTIDGRMSDFAQTLIRWQRTHGRHDLPWQACRDPYRIWISEIMLQQTQVDTVIPYYRRFLARFATIDALAGAKLEEVLPPTSRVAASESGLTDMVGDALGAPTNRSSISHRSKSPVVARLLKRSWKPAWKKVAPVPALSASMETVS